MAGVTLYGRAATASVVKEITIGTVLGLAAGLAWKVREHYSAVVRVPYACRSFVKQPLLSSSSTAPPCRALLECYMCHA